MYNLRLQYYMIQLSKFFMLKLLRLKAYRSINYKMDRLCVSIYLNIVYISIMLINKFDRTIHIDMFSFYIFNIIN